MKGVRLILVKLPRRKMAPLTAQGSQKRIESRCCQSPNSPISSKTFVRLRGGKFIVVMSDVWCCVPDHKHSVALLSHHQAPHSLSPRGGKCHKPLHWGAGKIKWDWWKIFCQFLWNKNSAVQWFILSDIIFWVKRHLKEQDLETGLPSPMPGTVRGSIPNGASAFAPHPPVCFLNIRYRTKLRSKASSPISW